MLFRQIEATMLIGKFRTRQLWRVRSRWVIHVCTVYKKGELDCEKEERGTRLHDEVAG